MRKIVNLGRPWADGKTRNTKSCKHEISQGFRSRFLYYHCVMQVAYIPCLKNVEQTAWPQKPDVCPESRPQWLAENKATAIRIMVPGKK